MRSLGLAAIAALAFGCTLFADPPERVAAQFWEALQAGDAALAQRVANAPTGQLLDALTGDQRIEEVILGEALRNENAAIVRTSIVTERGGRRLRSSFDTHLLRESDEWKVDVHATERELTTAIFAANMRQLGETLGEGMQHLGEAVEEGASEVLQAIVDALQKMEAERQ